ncbi:hypothetical protein POTOM_048490 [Populus tomentosa]|uniref:OTU domain-containing protein n=1 Tax=Populus tomentosa TaxID=118781 RepID=A0A8X7YGM0_POPTO|nr:hypothetical protein POTOM_048490 [Populus tomentosa]
MRNGTWSVGESSSSTSLSSQQDNEDDRMIALVLTEEYANLDGGVAKRLSNLAPVPHVPRINSYIPNLSDASLDHQRLLQRFNEKLLISFRLNVYGLYEVKVSGDGNCQFRALSEQMFKSPEHHKHVRKEVVKQLKEHRSLYEGHVPMKYKRYRKKMAKSGEWGDHVTLQAAADKRTRPLFKHSLLEITVMRNVETIFNHVGLSFIFSFGVAAFPFSLIYPYQEVNVVDRTEGTEAPLFIKFLVFYMQFAAKICLLTSFRDTCFIEIMPQYQPPKRELWLSFWSEVHYNSLYEIRGPMRFCTKMPGSNIRCSCSTEAEEETLVVLDEAETVDFGNKLFLSCKVIDFVLRFKRTCYDIF